MKYKYEKKPTTKYRWYFLMTPRYCRSCKLAFIFQTVESIKQADNLWFSEYCPECNTTLSRNK